MKYSSETNRILKSMYKTGSINKNQLSPSVLRSLFQDDYITNSSDYHDNNVYLTDEGKEYVEGLPPQTLSGKAINWIKDNALELIAIIISIIALLKP